MSENRIPEIETDRLVLRGPSEGDAEAWSRFITDPGDFRYMPWKISDETPIQRAKRIVDACAEGWLTEPPSAMGWIVTLKSDGQVIGLGGVDRVEDANEGELGYRLGKPFWGHGYATEVARAITRFAFENTDWQRIIAYVGRGNAASVRLLQGLGMTHVEDVDYLALMGNPTDIQIASSDAALYELRREDFSASDTVHLVRLTTSRSTE